jgi:hypothetical protein
MRIAAGLPAKACVRNSPRYIPKGDDSLWPDCTPGIRQQSDLTAWGSSSAADERIVKTWGKVKNLTRAPVAATHALHYGEVQHD